ncbi:unnamed protein product [Paramecium octaurelia]|uniref:Uncharacterized protein n=1 Tax=Paramecium octaurelia TaxID=43137 RepID=A0A8S1UDC3_PAROT|nr:unnamed protein product [Paramecium octaurelia]
MQIIGTFIIEMIMGSTLNWTILKTYALNELGENKEESHLQKVESFLLIVELNLGMLARLYLNKYFNRKVKMVVLLLQIVIYSFSLFLFGFIKDMPLILNILPNIYVFLLGLVLLDPMDSMLNENPLNFDKCICQFLGGISFGWLIFGLVLQLLINPKIGDLSDSEDIHYKRGCLIYAMLIFILGGVGTYLWFPRYSTVEEEFDSKENLRGAMNTRNVIHNTFLVQEKRMYKDEHFYMIMYQFIMLFTPAIGSLNYINYQGEYIFITYCVMGVATTIGAFLPILISQPYKINIIVSLCQIGMMIALNLLGVVYGHLILKLLCLSLQFILFGFILSFNVIILQTTYDNVVDNIPIAFIALTLAVLSQYAVFVFLGNKKLIQSIEFSLILLSFLTNILNNYKQ